MTLIPFSDADKIASKFLELLATCGIDPKIGGAIETEFLNVTQLLDIWTHPDRITGERSEEILRSAAGIHDFAAKVLAARRLPEFQSFHEHLELIAKGTLQTSLSQTTAGEPDDASRKLVELYVACLAIHCGSNLTLDHPVSSKGDNPDILLDYGNNRWAIAIKTPSSRHGQTLFENIKNAGKQIERSNSEKGIVLLNVKNSIDHGKLWQEKFVKVEDAIQALRVEIETLCSHADLDRPASDWDAVFKGSKAVLPVLFLCQSVVRLETPVSAETPVPIKMMVACSFRRTPDEEGLELAHCLSHWMQIILNGEPGPPPS